MSVYQYVAQSDPRGSRRLIESFGYDITNQNDLGRSLAELVSNVGESALKEVMKIHPDKDILLELNASEISSSDSCGCNYCKAKRPNNGYMNADGVTPTSIASNSTPDTTIHNNNTNILAHQTNTILVLATLVIVASIMLKK
jgi:hypothetical protein